eukprot:509090-Rhodomonas_salina.1
MPPVHIGQKVCAGMQMKLYPGTPGYRDANVKWVQLFYPVTECTLYQEWQDANEFVPEIRRNAKCQMGKMKHQQTTRVVFKFWVQNI